MVFGVLDHVSNAPVKVRHVDRPFRRQQSVPLCREKSKIAVGYPFELHRLALSLDLRLPFAGLDFLP